MLHVSNCHGISAHKNVYNIQLILQNVWFSIIRYRDKASEIEKETGFWMNIDQQLPIKSLTFEMNKQDEIVIIINYTVY